MTASFPNLLLVHPLKFLVAAQAMKATAMATATHPTLTQRGGAFHQTSG